MKGLPFVLMFTAMTFVAWGAYGPVLHHGAMALEHDSMRAFVGVGVAYFMIAVIIPVLILRSGGETGRWTISGAIYSLIAGAVGAVGALGIILALGYGGQTVYVMPLVFGFAPVVNTLVTAMLSRTFNQIRPIFVIGIVTAALGAGGVLAFKPTAKPAAERTVVDAPAGAETTSSAVSEPDVEPAPSTNSENEPAADSASHSNTGVSGEIIEDVEAPPVPADEPGSTDEARSVKVKVIPVSFQTPADSVTPGHAAPAAKPRTVDVWGVVFSIIVAALCWGSYGPMLHIGQSKMSGSRLRPFTCVGLAYFFIAVAAPLAVIYSRSTDNGAWTTGGMTWSFFAGVAGAIGALGVILAFNAGGKPYYVMPLIFGFAPVINTFISLSEAGTWSLVSPAFWISLAVVITGAVIVLTNAPRPKPHAAK